MKLNIDDLEPMQKLDALAKIVEIRKGDIPWHERSISAIGVIAFFSMLLATGVQTTKTGIEESRGEHLKQELRQLEKQRSELEGLVATVSKAVIEEYQKSGVIDGSARELLRFRLRSLVAIQNKRTAQALEQFNIALVLGEFGTAVDVLDEYGELLDETNPPDRISLAEYYLLRGAEPFARETIAPVESGLSKLPTPLRLRAIVVRAALDRNEEAHVPEVSALLKIDLQTARKELDRRVVRLREAARQHGKEERP